MKISTVKLELILGLVLLSAASLYAESPTMQSVTYSMPSPGASGAFTISQSNGPSGSGAGTIKNSFSGLLEFYMNTSATGRLSTMLNQRRYGISFDNFVLMQGFLSPSYLSVASSNTSCPGSRSYGWLAMRLRTPTALREPYDANSVGFAIGGTIDYSPSTSPRFTPRTAFTLAGLSSYSSLTFGIDAFQGDCASGSMKYRATANPPWDAYGQVFFSDDKFVAVGSGGNPLLIVGLPTQTLTNGFMTALNQDRYTGLYTYFSGTPNRNSYQNERLYIQANSAGTLLTLTQVSDSDDPTNNAAFGSITCPSGSWNLPDAGFCSGKLTLTANPGLEGNAVCMFGSNSNQKLIFCSAQHPNNLSGGITLFGSVVPQAMLAVVPQGLKSMSSPGNQTDNYILRNMTNSQITGLAIPSSPGDQLSGAFSLSGTPFTSESGTCGNTLAGHSSCLLAVRTQPSAYGVDVRTLKVAYNNKSTVVNATTPLAVATGLSSITITPSSTAFASGSTQQLTATAHFADASTADMTDWVAWSSTDATKISVSSTGLATFIAPGSATIGATAGVVSGSNSVNAVVAPPAPSSIVVNSSTATTVTVGWTDNSSTESGFQVERSLDGTNFTLALTTAANATSATVTALSAVTTYYFRVRAINVAGNSSYATSSSTKTGQRIFVTSGTMNGNIGGVASADAACQAEANAASLGGTWKAIVSAASLNVTDRISIQGGVYDLRPSGSGGPRRIATNSTDMWDGSIENPIQYSASGSALTSQTVWTGSTSSGGWILLTTCGSWTSSSGLGAGQVGVTNESGTGWISKTAGACNATYSLYCIDGQ